MTFNKLPSIFNRFRPVSIGFDDIFENFDRLMRDGFDQDSGLPHNFPYHDLVKTGDTTYNIEVALAGYSKNEISVEYADNLLRITSKKTEDENKKTTFTDKLAGAIHQGISKRYFSKVFSLADEVEIKGAEFKDGLLKVSLKRIVPKGKEPRKIAIK